MRAPAIAALPGAPCNDDVTAFDRARAILRC